MSLEVVFLGSSGAIRVPSFNCTCVVCEEARENSSLKRTRASIAVIGKEITVVDTSPDIAEQLERESIRRVDNVFLTHWHYDHVWGLSSLVDPADISKWGKIQVYMPEKSVPFWEKSMSYMEYIVDVHPVNPGDIVETSDASYEVVKSNHTDDSCGYIISNETRLGYLSDSYIPCTETIERLSSVDTLVLECTMDEMVYPEGEEHWLLFCLDEAVDFWRSLNVDECILTHLSCHSYIEGDIVAGLTANERAKYESAHKGLTFAYDGMRIRI